MHRNNLAIERDCSWGVPEKEPHYVTATPAPEKSVIEQLLALLSIEPLYTNLFCYLVNVF